MHGSTGEDRENDFRRMVEVVRRNAQRTPELTTPHLRLWEVVALVQRFVESVRRANTPRRVFGGPERDPKQRESLRRHREAHLDIRDAEIGLMPLLMQLTNLDCTFVFGDSPLFGINRFEWDSELWLPLSRWAEAGFALLYTGRDKADWPRCLSSKDFEEWLAEEEAIKQDVLERMKALLPEDGYPVVDVERGIVKWRGEIVRLCDGKKTKKPLLLFECLANAKGDPVTHEEICDALDYPRRKSGDTNFAHYERRRADLLRKDIQRLRADLRASRVPQLSDAIITKEPGCVRLDVAELASNGCLPSDSHLHVALEADGSSTHAEEPFVNSQEIPSFARSSPEKPGKSRKRKSS